jgi:hypothetical protein
VQQLPTTTKPPTSARDFSEGRRLGDAGGVSAQAEFVDASLQREATWERAAAFRGELGDELTFYGASVGAVRGAIRDMGRRYPGLQHDEVVALSSELWSVPVFERRLAAVVLLQSHVALLGAFDLTRIEGFLRGAQVRALVDPLSVDVLAPLLGRLDGLDRRRAESVLERWSKDGNPWLRRAAQAARDPRTRDRPPNAETARCTVSDKGRR